jgi:hypothetical protein
MYINMYVLHHCLIPYSRAREERKKEGKRKKEKKSAAAKKQSSLPHSKAHPRHTHRRRSRELTDNKDYFYIEKEKNTERYEKQKAQARAPGALRAGRL